MNRYKLGIGLMTVVIIFGTFVGTAAIQERDLESGSDIEVAVDGGIVKIERSTATLWSSEAVNVLLGPSVDRAGEHYIYCLNIDGEGWDCQQGTLAYGDGYSFDLSASDLSTGRHQLTARIHEDNLGYDNPLIEEVTFAFHVISKEDDTDNDGLSNQREIRTGTNYQASDTDADGLEDRAEEARYNTDPTVSDTDDDGLDDGTEINKYGTDPTNPHSDSDGLDDGTEVNDHGTNPTKTDTDGDRLDDGTEVNDHGTDPSKSDTDGDGIDDRTELDQGSDPTDPESPSPEENGEADGTSPQESNDDQSSVGDESNTDQTDSPEESNIGGQSTDEDEEEEVQRGFFTNDPDSGLAVLNDPLNITTIGFILSILGILMELRRGD